MKDWRRGLHSQALALELPQIISQPEGVWDAVVGTVPESKNEEEAGSLNK